MIYLLFALNLVHARTPQTAPRPHRLHWCEALISAHDPERAYHAQHANSLNDVNGLIGRALAKVAADYAPVLKINRRLATDQTIARQGNFGIRIKDVDKASDYASRSAKLIAIEKSLHLLERDVTSLREDTIAFGQVLKGRAQIDAYLKQIGESARALDAANDLDVNKPFRNRRRIIAPLIGMAINGPLAYWLTGAMLGNISAESYVWATASGLAAAFYVGRTSHHVQRFFTYLAGLTWDRARLYYQNHYEPGRQYNYPRQLEQMVATVGEGPRPLAYQSIALTITSSMANQILRSTGRELPTAAAVESKQENPNPLVILLDSRRLLIDVFAYQDDDGEPVLMSFVRIKRPDRRGKKKTPPRAREADQFAPGDLKPVGT